MALTYTARDKLLQQAAANGTIGQYTGLKGVSGGTGMELNKRQNGYNEGENVTKARNNLDQVMNNRPGEYISKYTGRLDDIMKQIENPEKFKYSFNDDELFKYYADLYTQKGQQASMDVMGQAAALTGGYANSVAQQVGQQAYQGYLTQLFDRGMELRDDAYQMYLNDLANKKDAYNMLANADQTDYGRYRDTVSDWQTDRAYANDVYKDERDFDYGAYQDELNYWTNMAQLENADAIDTRDFERAAYENDRNYDRSVLESDRAYDRGVLESDRAYDRDVLESDRAYDRGVLESDRNYDRSVLESDRDEQYRRDALAQSHSEWEGDNKYKYDAMDADKAESDRKYAYQTALAILEKGQMPSAELLALAGLSEEDAQKLLAQLKSGGSGTNTKTTGTNDKDISWYTAQLIDNVDSKIGTDPTLTKMAAEALENIEKKKAESEAKKTTTLQKGLQATQGSSAQRVGVMTGKSITAANKKKTKSGK